VKNKIKTKIFLDSGDPADTKKIKKIFSSLNGQTTNPSLIAKNPQVIKKIKEGKKFSSEELIQLYKKIVRKIAKEIPKGSISIEVYADNNTTSDEILNACRKFSSWISNAHIKIPITKEGLKAAEQAVKEGINVNMTLCFSQKQAAAVYSATKGSKKGQVFISPFIGRLDDIGINGVDLIANILKMYKKGDGHVEVLAASIRNLGHLLYCFNLKCDIVTVPAKVLKEWSETNFNTPNGNKNKQKLKKLKYDNNISIDSLWKSVNIKNKLTDQGIKKFCDDWNNLIK